MSNARIYKNIDYRCLAPNSHKDPKKWKTYNIGQYRTAFNSKTLNEVKTYKYDNNFNNWIDPKVLKLFTKKPAKHWRKSYKLYNIRLVSWDGEDIGTMDSSKCWRICAKMVRKIGN